MIDSRILKKYHMRTLEEYKQDWGDEVSTEIIFYKTFLSTTDYIANKIVEAETAEEAEKIKSDYKQELKYRKIAREKINELEGVE